jgi:hypothetical protein
MVGVHQALLARNVEFSANSVGTRHGYGRIQALPHPGSAFPLNAVGELYNWIAPFSHINAGYSDSALVAIHGFAGSYGLISVYTLNTSVTDRLFTSTINWSAAYLAAIGSASVVGIGFRLFVVTVGSQQQALGPGNVYTVYSNGGVAGFYTSPPGLLFNGPSSYPPSITQPAAGLVTAGTHRFGYLIEFINGFTTRVSPDGSSVFGDTTGFIPVSLVSSGALNARLTFAANWQVLHLANGEIAAVSVVMTTTTNLNQYYIVPGSRTVISPVGSAAGFTIDVSISDADLSSQGVDATPYLFLATNGRNNSTSNPLNVRHLCLFGNRMAYLASQSDTAGNQVDCIYVSDPNNYQAITLDQNIIQLPGQRPIATMFRMGASDYILGPHEIWSLTDNNDVPVTWAAAQLLDGKHGTQAIHGVEVSPSGNYAWIADQGGLYLFTGGPITSLPVSYYQTSDWNRINWAKAYCVKIRDDASNKRVHVMVPLDGASTPSHILTWDYTNGISPETVMYSLDSLSGYSLGAMDLVRNDLLAQATGNAGKIELWLASSGTDYFLRKMSDADFRFYRRNDATLTSIVVAANVATATTAAAHGLWIGQKVTIAGATVDTDLNGGYTIASTPTSTTFTFATVSVANATYTEATLVASVTPYQDGTAAIAATYRGCPLPGRGVSQGQILMHHGFHARLKGAGTLTPTIYDIDAANSFACRSLTLATAPDKDELFLARMRNELSFVEFTSNAIDTYFILSYLRWYYSPYLMQR